MKRIDCPDIGLRNIAEFAWGGEVLPEVEAVNPTAWAASVWRRSNAAGAVSEWWYHIPTAAWLIVERNTTTDEQIGIATPT